MKNIEEKTVRLPVRATIKLIDGEMVVTDAEYADVSMMLLGQLLSGAFEEWRDKQNRG